MTGLGMCWLWMGLTNTSTSKKIILPIEIMFVITQQGMDPERQKRREDISKAMSFIK